MKRKCEICGIKTDSFLPINPCFKEEQVKYGHGPSDWETLNEEEYVCAACGASDRERMCASFLNKVLKGKKIRLNVLEVAPGQALRQFFLEKYPFCNYKTVDLFMENVDYQIDIQDMGQLRNGQFDLVICFHVLEHVKDDKRALKEFYRVISDCGIGLFLVPIDLGQKEIEEEWGLTKEENIRRFGQADHVRKYSKAGFLERLEEAGFQIIALDRAWFGDKNAERNAYSETAALYVAVKNRKYGKASLEKNFTKNYYCYRLKKAGSPSVRYSIDGIERKTNAISLWGWIFKEPCTSGQIEVVLCLKLRRKIVYMKKIELEKREDVGRMFGERHADCGIGIMLPINRIEPGKYRLAFIVIDGSEADEIDVGQEIII